MKKQKPIIVIAGLDSDDRPHAARFTNVELEVVAKAAVAMEFQIGLPQSPKSLTTVRALAAGKIFGTGRALVPYVKRELYDQLMSLITFYVPDVPAASTGIAQTEPSNTNDPGADPWAAIGVGTTVLSKDGEGWWDAVVIAVDKAGDKLTLRWRDYPGFKKFVRERQAVAVTAADPAVGSDLWTAISVGATVIAKDEESWREAVVVDIEKTGGRLSVRWRDYPELKKFTKERRAVALMGTAPPIPPLS